MQASSSGYQMALFHVLSAKHVVNVASVPQRSPFRYPGGKTWLVPRIRQWLTSKNVKPSLLIEPFAGGAIIGLTAAFESLAEHVLLVELDPQVAAVWKTIFSDDAEWLARRILSFELTEGNVRTEIADSTGTTRETAFRTILKNRTFHGGILAPGASLIKHGENGKGIRSRWYANTLARRIRAIATLCSRFTFIEGDGLEIMERYALRKDVAFFIDPPYTAGDANGKRAGTRLYSHHRLDHERLFALSEQMAGNILMSYDNDSSVRLLAERHGFEVHPITMKNTHHAQMTELLVSRSFEWLI